MADAQAGLRGVLEYGFETDASHVQDPSDQSVITHAGDYVVIMAHLYSAG
jgi:hypothetical protein